MARQSSAPAQRQLTLTEELEKLEQSITLTLQEIDHNFSRAHRIVTSSILPVVEQYAEHSRNVWEGSKFWKQFFEASANVSLSGYEEAPEEGDEGDEESGTLESSTVEAGTPSSYSSAPHAHDEDFTPASHRYGASTSARGEGAEAVPSSPDFATPRPARTGERIAAYDSPYEALRREVHGADADAAAPPSAASSTSTLPSTPRAQTYSADAVAVSSSPPVAPTPGTGAKSSQRGGGGAGASSNNDVLLHRVLDRNYRIQATPHAGASQPRLPKHVHAKTPARTPGTARKRTAGAHETTAKMGGLDLDLDSSPLEEAPRLQTDLWRNSPIKRVPGVSVLATTPAGKKKAPPGAGRSGATTTTTTKPSTAAAEATRYLGFSDDDDDDDVFDGLPEGMSPPKTMQFHVPQSKLLKTPAREASRQIVADLLKTAGTTDEDDDDYLEPGDSPSLVQKAGEGLDESF